MKKNVIVDTKAQKEFHEFPRIIQKEFRSLIDDLEEEGKLDYPDAKKLQKNLFEMRVRQEGIYRGFYAYIQKETIIIVRFFQKKTQKTPLKEIEIALRRLKQYDY